MADWNDTGNFEMYDELDAAKRKARKQARELQAKVDRLEAQVAQQARELAQIKALLGIEEKAAA